MSGLRGRSAVAADQRSALPRVPGIPWWAASIVAITLTAIGVAFDAGSGNDALGAVFAVCYVLGCLGAVLAVRQSGLFTAVIQPPLILFVAVPFAYFVFHGSTITGIKDTLINYGYPLIERFPLMFFTSATVLAIGLVRWYLATLTGRAIPRDGAADASDESGATDEDGAAPAATRGRRSSRSSIARAARAAAAATAAAVASSDPGDDDPAPRPPRRSTRPAAGSSRAAGAAPGTGSRRSSRHSRPPETEIIEPVVDRPRRRSTPPVDPTAEPRRRPRSGEPRDRDRPERTSREPRDRDRPDRASRERREPRDRRPLPPLDRRSSADRPERDRYERPQRRDRSEAYERTERPERVDRPERPRRPRAADYEPYEPPATRVNGSGGTHHPISRVRYRGTDDGESRTEHRTRPRQPRHSAPDSWDA
ncbi:DUF6542 domain-containing protein [Mycolicibacterium sp. 050158]|uniref:DUF6542 domain-containing protein n=1 Tax=Mycolicibacterium sp. 050158 TaxID=3090602 RepID=UPI00299F326A|nr:DUF6542 domain-containing protein [Mycolicibacterium sp. 050158]MDX1890521.1 DUF6542 domain-containing protein [Mycolicibacterium sp. 050158]